MPSCYHLDFETYSDCDISLGAFRYAQDPSTRILLCAVAKDDDPPLVYDSRDPLSEESREAVGLLHLMAGDKTCTIYAHNAQFEWAVILSRWFYDIPPIVLPSGMYLDSEIPSLLQLRCTAAMCRRAGIPASLAGASDFLKLSVCKDKIGSRLIQLFCVPQKKPLNPAKVTVDGRHMSEHDAWLLFKEYCRTDVETERELAKRLRAFELRGTALEAFQFDMEMNTMGVPVDTDALKKAQAMVEEYQDKLIARFSEITGLTPSQTAASLEWLQERGYRPDNLQAQTMEAWLDHPKLTPEAAEALGIRAALSFAATKKIKAMIDCACSDGRIRGAFLWYGAQRTGRWSSRLVQFQNFKRPVIKNTATAYELVRTGTGMDGFELMYDNPMEALASIIRNFIREPDARMIDLDLANIEGRVAGWLAGDEVLLDEFRAGLDVYKVMASSIYGVDINEVDADQRMTGKVAVLSCGYGTGWRKFQDMALAYGHELDDATCRLTVYKYRKARRPIVQAWQDFGDAAIAALRNPGESYFAGEHVRFKYGRIGGFPALIMTLPSGRSLIYPEPQLISKEITADILVEADDGAIIMEERQFSATSINFYGQQQGKTVWGRIETHGSKLFENACQAVAGDFLVHGLLDARAAGFRVTMVVHDQALCPWQYTGADKEFLRLMTNIPPWAPGFPLKAEVKVVECYSK